MKPSDSTVREADALAVTVVRAIETQDRSAAHWSDADRAWVSQAAAAEVGESAPPARVVAARARLALTRLQERFPNLQQGLNALSWRPWLGTVLVLLAFATGLLADHMGGSQRINVLAPPVLLLLVWNLLVYLMLLLGPLLRLGRLQLPDVRGCPAQDRALPGHEQAVREGGCADPNGRRVVPRDAVDAVEAIGLDLQAKCPAGATQQLRGRRLKL